MPNWILQNRIIIFSLIYFMKLVVYIVFSLAPNFYEMISVVINSNDANSIRRSWDILDLCIV